MAEPMRVYRKEQLAGSAMLPVCARIGTGGIRNSGGSSVGIIRSRSCEAGSAELPVGTVVVTTVVVVVM